MANTRTTDDLKELSDTDVAEELEGIQERTLDSLIHDRFTWEREHGRDLYSRERS